MGERGRANGDLLGRLDRSISLGPRKWPRKYSRCAQRYPDRVLRGL